MEVANATLGVVSGRITVLEHFAGVLEKAHKQLDTVQNSIKDAGVRTRAIERQLRKVEELPADEARLLLGDDGVEAGADAGESPDAD